MDIAGLAVIAIGFALGHYASRPETSRVDPGSVAVINIFGAILALFFWVFAGAFSTQSLFCELGAAWQALPACASPWIVSSLSMTQTFVFGGMLGGGGLIGLFTAYLKKKPASEQTGLRAWILSDSGTRWTIFVMCVLAAILTAAVSFQLTHDPIDEIGTSQT